MLDVWDFGFHIALSFGSIFARKLVYHILGICLCGCMGQMDSMGHLNPYLTYLATLLHTGICMGLVSHISTVLKIRKHLKHYV